MNNRELVPVPFLDEIGKRVRILQWEPGDPERGHDIDCAVDSPDPMWPLRVGRTWALCQRLHYDVNACYWILDNGADTVEIDSLHDPRGMGQDGFPTATVFGSDGIWASAAARAAYLTSKRIRKGSLASQDWEKIAELAAEDQTNYLDYLTKVFHPHTAERLAKSALKGIPPEPGVVRAAKLSRAARRLRNPVAGLSLAGLTSLRVVERVLRPTGMTVIIVGPDGTGKSTLAELLGETSSRLFRRHHHVHWRPGLIPRLGAIARREMADASDPHGQAPHGPVVSLGVALYYWFDFLVGGLITQGYYRTRTRLVICERGWWDVIVDPIRYRLRIHPAILTVLGRLLPRPDIVFVLAATPEILMARKGELQEGELRRQMEMWRTLSFPARRRVYLDASRPLEEIGRRAREEMVAALDQRNVRRLPGGWVGVPKANHPRWYLPRSPVRTAVGALAIYQPVTAAGRAGWSFARLAGSLGAFRLLPRGPAPPREVRGLIAPHIPRGCSIAVARGNGETRFVVLIVNEDGDPLSLVKLRTDEAGFAFLKTEAEAIQRAHEVLISPLSAPVIEALDPAGVLVTRFAHWSPRRRPWEVPPDVAYAIGSYSATEVGRRAHGDFAPWNLLRGKNGCWTLIDWERQTENATPFYDLFHHFLRSHALLGKPTEAEILNGMSGVGPLAECIDAFAAGARLDVGQVAEAFLKYLNLPHGDLGQEQGRGKVVAAGRRLQSALGGSA
jgi:thymidylate kinase